MIARSLMMTVLCVLTAAPPVFAGREGRKRPYRLKGVNLRERVIWGSECRLPEGKGLAFGGQDQRADDGRPHTRILVDGAWKPIHEALRAANPLQALSARTWTLRNDVKNARARMRSIFFKGLAAGEEAKRAEAEVAPAQGKAAAHLAGLIADLNKADAPGDYEKTQAAFAAKHLQAAAVLVKPLEGIVTAEAIKAMHRAQIHLEIAAEALDAEPPPRALSPIVYDAKTGLYVIFGGDHLDYLTNDTWVFDPAGPRWFQRHPAGAPTPRAKHALAATGDGEVTLNGGYRYFSNTDYVGGQYIGIDDGEWIYDVEKNAWTGSGKLVPADSREYRTRQFHPDFYLQGEKPGAAAFEATLKSLPVNEWVATKPPYRPRQNRDWGDAVIDPARDMILYWSGGHSAHGGTDVLHFHLATNRWELAYPVEYPLGQLYSNTSYPSGFNFNRRPWMTGHTYHNYNVDPPSGRMVETGHRRNFYVYDPDVADWTGRGPKAKGMAYNSAFYDSTVCATPKGALCWAKSGRLFLYDGGRNTWTEIKPTGDKLPGSSTDNSMIAYDSKRDRVIFIRKPYGRTPYNGQVHSLELRTLTVKALSPEGAAGAGKIAWTDRGCYDATNDLVLLATYLKDAGDGHSRTPAYDCAGNRWVSLDIAYKTTRRGQRTRRAFPHGHSAGIVHDAKRQLVWGVTTNCDAYVLRLDAAKADMKTLE